MNDIFYKGYIYRDEEFQSLEYFKSDYKDLGDYDTAMRFFRDYRVKEDMCWAVFDSVMEIKECGYKEDYLSYQYYRTLIFMIVNIQSFLT